MPVRKNSDPEFERFCLTYTEKLGIVFYRKCAFFASQIGAKSAAKFAFDTHTHGVDEILKYLPKVYNRLILKEQRTGYPLWQ